MDPAPVVRRLEDLSDDDLRDAYAVPSAREWVRLNFVVTVDGSATGADGLSESINNPADKRVFHLLRELADVIVVGAGTVRDEGYRPNPKPFVVVTRSGSVPPTLREGDLSRVHIATGAAAPHLAEARALLGDRVLVLGEQEPDLRQLRPALAGRGLRHVLCEGGPTLAHDLLVAGCVDELCLTTVPLLVAGDGPRLLDGGPLETPLRLLGLLQSEGTLLARWGVATDS